MDKFIGGQCYKVIDGEWHKLSPDGFVWEECDSATKWAVSGWVVN